jgi:hypothetical protein
MISSRLSDWSGSVEPLELELLSEEAAVEFLLERTKNRRVSQASDCDTARELANELDGLALGLEQAGAFISKMRCSFGCSVARYSGKFSHGNYDGSFGAESGFSLVLSV